MRSVAGRAVLVLALASCVAALAAHPAAADGAASAAAEVTYVSGASIYIDAGANDGLRVGDRVVADGVVLEVVETSASRAICRLVEGEASVVAVGLTVTYAPAPAPSTAATPPGAAAAASDSPRRSGAGLHGRVGVRYLFTRDGLDAGADFDAPGLEVRLDGPSLGGTPWNVHLDVRARRVTTTGSDGTEIDDDRNRVYRAALGWDRPGPGWRFAAGRQVVPQLANVSVFDGVVAAWDGERFGAGGFVGTQPDGTDWGYSSDVAEGGGWFGVRSRAGSALRWTVDLGAVASRADGDVNREFAFVQGRVAGRRFDVLATQEVDVNRDWKRDEAGESTLEPTSSFLVLRYRITDTVAVVGGYDNRRNVRLYRDRVTPATEFDDAFRRGLWAGVRVRAGRHARFGVSGRTSDGGDAGEAESLTVDAALVRLTPANVGVRVRATSWENDRLDGGVYMVTVSFDPWAAVGLAVEAGLRDETSSVNPLFDDSVGWIGAELHLELGRGVWALVSYERAEGDLEEVDQGHVMLAWQF